MFTCILSTSITYCEWIDFTVKEVIALLLLVVFFIKTMVKIHGIFILKMSTMFFFHTNKMVSHEIYILKISKVSFVIIQMA